MTVTVPSRIPRALAATFDAAGRRRVLAASALGLVAAVGIAVGFLLLNWLDSPAWLSLPDSYQYLRRAFAFIGDPNPDLSAMHLHCYERYATTPDVIDYCARKTQEIDRVFGPRYVDKFRIRVGYPLVMAAFMWFMGAAGAVAATFAVFVGLGVFGYLAVRAYGFGIAPALAAEAVLLGVGCGYWASRMLSEGLMLLFMCVSLLGIGQVARGSRRMGLSTYIAGLVGSFATREPNGMATAAVLALTAAVIALRREEQRQQALTVFAGSVACMAGFAVTSTVLGFPGITEGFQEYLSGHFTRPDVPNVWLSLLQAQGDLVLGFLRDLPRLGLVLVVALLGLVQAQRCLKPWAWPWMAVGATGVLGALLFPDPEGTSRYLLPVWLPIMVGLASCLVSARSATTNPFRPTPVSAGRTPR